MTTTGSVQATPSDGGPFIHRGRLDPYRIIQMPDFMVHSHVRTDIVMQRLVFPHDPKTEVNHGAWHTHPGPSFIIVTEGRLKLTRFTEKDGCTETEVFGPGEERQAFFEIGNEVHRATVLGDKDAVVHITRFNVPVGGATTTPADDPNC